ncbi:hypothetical protein BCU68_08495 [Vibrio sp. 10N.286.49.B3]|uniref:hypothetical protein n=1 Tax=Vibrio sp. 10N.286.49.B3 TaxID=1880855 RepID=UPI000C829E3D|nr:hypothetical protein [Vibrio sp. 10N.286.49.B3]PMH37128.1 hypothetical protein BCU68_08495 [Vibrio sp. 10N.286.49.B3]
MLKKKYVKNHFGEICDVSTDNDGNLYITNKDGHTVKMSYSKWFRQIPDIEKKCHKYKGKCVDILTSQTKKEWEPAKYFCDVIRKDQGVDESIPF